MGWASYYEVKVSNGNRVSGVEKNCSHLLLARHVHMRKYVRFLRWWKKMSFDETFDFTAEEVGSSKLDRNSSCGITTELRAVWKTTAQD